MSSSLLGGPSSSSAGVVHKETYRLLNLTDDSEDITDEANALQGTTRTHSGAEPVPDLNLRLPPAGGGGVPSASSIANGVHRIKKKIRLKRRQRDQNRAGGLNSGAEDGEEALLRLGEGSPAGAMMSGSRCGCAGGGAAMAVTGLAVVAVVIGLGYLGAQQHLRVSALEMQLEGVVGERNDLKEKYQGLHSQVQEIALNQSHLQVNVTQSATLLTTLSSQVKALNASLEGIGQSLLEAPELKDLPREVDEVKNNVAKFGSRLAELESKVNKEDTEQATMRRRSVQDQELSRSLEQEEKQNSLLHSVVNATHVLRLEMDQLAQRVAVVQETSQGNWQDVQSDITNAKSQLEVLHDRVSLLEASSNSSEALCYKLEERLDNLISNGGSSDIVQVKDNQGNNNKDSQDEEV